MTDGITATRLPDGTVRIVATAKGKEVRLRVTREFARRFAAKLVTASMDEEPELPDAFAELFRKMTGR